MTELSTSIEANMLVSRPLGDELATQSEDLHATIENAGFRVVGTRVSPGEHLLLTCDRVQILVAFCAVPYGIEDFSGASRPEDDPLTDRIVLDTLERHSGSLKVLVTDRPNMRHVASQAEKRHLCWEITDLLTETLPVDLVFWNDTDTLFSSGEFARAAPPEGDTPVILRPQPVKAKGRQAEPEYLHPGAHAFAMSPDAGFDDLDDRTARNCAYSADWARVSRGHAPEAAAGEDAFDELITDDVARKGTNYGLIALLAALNLPVAIAVLYYQLFRGGNAHVVAKVVCVTALGVAVNDADMAAKAMTLI